MLAAEEMDAPSPELLLILAGLIVERERRGTEWCFEHGIGPRRHVLGSPRAPNVTEMPLARSRGGLAFGHSQRKAQGALAAECARCAGCRLGRE